jgi:hypothetical protein
MAYVNNNPLNYNDPTGHGIYSGDDYDPANLTEDQLVYYRVMTGEWKKPTTVWDYTSIKDDPVELMARAVLAEEGEKIGTGREDDALGVAWAIRNRHDSGYYSNFSPPPVGINSRLSPGDENYDAYNWYYSATSEIDGMPSTLAHDPLNGWQGHWNSNSKYGWKRVVS